MPKRIIIVRHGETDWNRERVLQGHQDLPLNWQGFLQAKEAAVKLQSESFDAIFSSDLKRAHQTAMMIVAGCSRQVLTTPLLRERSFGELEGVCFMQRVKIAPWMGGLREEFHARVHNTSWIHREFKIETDEELNARIKKFCQEHLTPFKNKNVAIVAHGGIIGMMLLHFGVTLEFVKGKNIKNTEIFVLVKRGKVYQLEKSGKAGE